MNLEKENNLFLKEGERIDDLERNGYKIIQDRKRFCFGMDAVLLSGFAVVKPGEKALDLGTGTGIIPILLEAQELSQYCLRQKLWVKIFMLWKSSRTVLTWQREV